RTRASATRAAHPAASRTGTPPSRRRPRTRPARPRRRAAGRSPGCPGPAPRPPRTPGTGPSGRVPPPSGSRTTGTPPRSPSNSLRSRSLRAPAQLLQLVLGQRPVEQAELVEVHHGRPAGEVRGQADVVVPELAVLADARPAVPGLLAVHHESDDALLVADD